MEDNKSVIDQLHKIQYISKKFKIMDMNMDELVIVSYGMDKLSPYWLYK